MHIKSRTTTIRENSQSSHTTDIESENSDSTHPEQQDQPHQPQHADEQNGGSEPTEQFEGDQADSIADADGGYNLSYINVQGSGILPEQNEDGAESESAPKPFQLERNDSYMPSGDLRDSAERIALEQNESYVPGSELRDSGERIPLEPNDSYVPSPDIQQHASERIPLMRNNSYMPSLELSEDNVPTPELQHFERIPLQRNDSYVPSSKFQHSEGSVFTPELEHSTERIPLTRNDSYVPSPDFQHTERIPLQRNDSYVPSPELQHFIETIPLTRDVYSSTESTRLPECNDLHWNDSAEPEESRAGSVATITNQEKSVDAIDTHEYINNVSTEEQHVQAQEYVNIQDMSTLSPQQITESKEKDSNSTPKEAEREERVKDLFKVDTADCDIGVISDQVRALDTRRVELLQKNEYCVTVKM